MAAMLLTVNFMSFLVISLRHEAEVIHSTCYRLLQKQEATETGWTWLDLVPFPASTQFGAHDHLCCQVVDIEHIWIHMVLDCT